MLRCSFAFRRQPVLHLSSKVSPNSSAKGHSCCLFFLCKVNEERQEETQQQCGHVGANVKDRDEDASPRQKHIADGGVEQQASMCRCYPCLLSMLLIHAKAVKPGHMLMFQCPCAGAHGHDQFMNCWKMVMISNKNQQEPTTIGEHAINFQFMAQHRSTASMFNN